MTSDYLLETTAGKFSVRDYGGFGPDCLLIHGTGQNAVAWDHVAETLVRGVRAVAFDMRGHGQTPEVSHDPEQYWRDIGPIATALGLRSPILVGHSTGAYAATAHAAAGGDVAQIVCVDGFTLDPVEHLQDPARHAPPPLKTLFEMFRYGWSASSAERAAYIDQMTEAAPDDWLNAGVEPALLRHMLERCFEKIPGGWRKRPSLEEIAVVSAPSNGPIAPCLGIYDAIDVPLLFVWARQGLFADRYADLSLLAAAPNRRLVCLDSSHNVPMQHPVELATLILKEIEAASPS
jgi:pimeloyl-ACP methyl ester carboxylesterase